MKRSLYFYFIILTIFISPILLIAIICLPKKRKELIWGPVPIINNQYWSKAMSKVGLNSKTFMHGYYSAINKREDFDHYFEDVVPKWIWPLHLRTALSFYFAFLYIIRNASVVHLPFSGGPLSWTPLWWIEAYLLKWAGIQTVVLAYGADIYMYSRVIDPSLRNALLLSYPEAAKRELKITKSVNYWIRHANIVISGYITDGVGRWDVSIPNPICIDLERWKHKSSYSSHDGRNGVVKVIHTPNHRGVKGTEFLVQTIKELQAEGLQVELVLLERVPNDKVREMMQEVDILADQFIITGYGLAAIEGMASGLPVMANLDNPNYTVLFRRYSFLNECPIVSTTPETIKGNLKALITHPELRKQLGQAGREYVEKYHSFDTAQYLFGSIYDKILYGKDVDLMNLFHPLKSEYNKRKPFVKHPLIENRLPEYYLISNK